MLQAVRASYLDSVHLIQAGKYEAALCALQIVATSDEMPQEAKADAWSTAGTCYEKMGRKELAYRAYRHAIALNPRCAEALHNMGTVAVAAHRGDEAELFFSQALHQNPKFINSIAGLVGALVEQGRFADAVFPAKRALEMDPANAAAHWNLCLALMGSGDFTNGLAEHEWRRNLPGWPARANLPQSPEWTGGKLDGVRLLVLAEQGFGDMAMWARLVPELEARGATVILEAHEPMVGIFKWLPGVSEVSVFCDPLPPHDMHTWMGSLGYRFGLTRSQIHGNPYLTVPPMPLGFDDGLTVGVAWQGRKDHGNDHNRSMRSDVAAELCSYPKVRWVSLQFDATPPTTNVIDMRDKIHSATDTAAIMRSCDLVVSVDSGLAHIAGSMGVPVWTMLPKPCEWRWGLGDDTGDRTPWYDSMTLIRQPKAGDWSSVIQSVHQRLDNILAGLQ